MNFFIFSDGFSIVVSMSLSHFEKRFNRALSLSFSRKKWLLVFPILALCGLLIVIFRTISLAAGDWIQLSLVFLPIFITAGILSALGLVLIEMYRHDVAGEKVEFSKVIKKLLPLFWGAAYLIIPLIFAYLILWMALGIFYLLRAIPMAGPLIGAIFSFGPFLLVLGSIALGIFTLLGLFYLPPAAAMKGEMSKDLFKSVVKKIRTNPFQMCVPFLFALFPLLLVIGVLSLAAVVTHMMYITTAGGLSIVLKWFFMMLPFCALLAPVVTFFFHFSLETYLMTRESAK